MNDHALRVAQNNQLMFKGNLKMAVAVMALIGVGWHLFQEGALLDLVLGLVALFVGTDGALNLLDGELERARLFDEARSCPALAHVSHREG